MPQPQIQRRQPGRIRAQVTLADFRRPRLSRNYVAYTCDGRSVALGAVSYQSCTANNTFATTISPCPAAPQRPPYAETTGPLLSIPYSASDVQPVVPSILDATALPLRSGINETMLKSPSRQINSQALCCVVAVHTPIKTWALAVQLIPPGQIAPIAVRILYLIALA
ncbi:hypothetical protein BDV93DRAFT_509256 [Ceratobasidium sp. AG-I]|nr:hypothetical protein BDV93DRAFT_509256 [Ceratobasidium sp. AG-I]